MDIHSVLTAALGYCGLVDNYSNPIREVEGSGNLSMHGLETPMIFCK